MTDEISPSSSSRRNTRFLGWAVTLYAAFSLTSMAAMNIAAALVMFAFIAELLTGGRSGVFRKEIRYPDSRLFLFLSIALAGACALSLVAGQLWPLSYAGKTAEIRFFSDFAKAWYLFWPFVLAGCLRLLAPKERKRALQVWLITFAFLCILGLAQFVSGWPRPQPIPGHEPFFHVTLFLGHHLSVASVFIFPFFAVLDLVLVRSRADALGLPRWFWLSSAILGALALFGTYSRMLWIALPLGVLLWLMLSLRGRLRWALVLSVIVFGIGALQWQPVSSRLSAGMGIHERVDLWKANLDFFSKRPLTGVGWRNGSELAAHYFAEKKPGLEHYFVGHAHNNFLEMLGGTGLLGALAWLAWAFGVIWMCWRVRVTSITPHLAKGLFCAWIVFHLNGLTQVNFWEGKVMHQMSWVVAWILFWLGSAHEAHEGKKRSL